MAEKKNTSTKSKKTTTAKKAEVKPDEGQIVMEQEVETTEPIEEPVQTDDATAAAIEEENAALKAVEEKMEEVKAMETMGNGTEDIEKKITDEMAAVNEAEAEVEKATDATVIDKAVTTGDKETAEAEIKKSMDECKKVNEKLQKAVKKPGNQVNMTAWWNGYGDF